LKTYESNKPPSLNQIRMQVEFKSSTPPSEYPCRMLLSVEVDGRTVQCVTGPTLSSSAEYDAMKADPARMRIRDLYCGKLENIMQTVFRVTVTKPEAYDLLYPICLYSDFNYKVPNSSYNVSVTSRWSKTRNWDDIDVTDAMVTQCFQCGKVLQCNATKACGRCRMATYCDKECQLLHWDRHKEGCRRTAKMAKMAKKSAKKAALLTK
jgi:hypothetical protein